MYIHFRHHACSTYYFTKSRPYVTQSTVSDTYEVAADDTITVVVSYGSSATLTFEEAVVCEITDNGRTLSLDGVIFINQYFGTSGLDMTGEEIALNSGLLMWTNAVTEEDAIVGSEDAFVNTDVVYDSSANEYKVQSDGIVAKAYADTVYLRIYVQIGDGEYVYGSLIAYSVREYCDGRIAKSSNTKLKNLCAYMLHYGAAAQNYFSYNTGDLANKNVPTDTYPADIYDASMIADVAEVNTSIVQSDIVSNNGRTLSLSGAIEINYYFGISGVTPVTAEVLLWEGVSGELTIDNVTSVLETVYDSSNDEYKATGNEIAAKNYDTTIYACARFIDAEGNVYFSDVTGYHPDAYAAGRISNSSNAKLVSLCKALVVYGDYADVYFG